MSKIGIIEIVEKNHEVAELCKIALGKSHSNNIILFANKEIADHARKSLGTDLIKTGLIEIVEKKADESTWAFVKKIEKYSSNLDLLIANTIANGSLYFINPQCKFTGVFYNLNWWFYDTHNIPINLKKIFSLDNWTIKNPICHITSGAIMRRKIADKCDFAIVEYEPLKKELETNPKYKFKKPVYYFPTRPYYKKEQKILNNNKQNKFTLIIPGQVERMRRDYQQILNVFQYLNPKIKEKFKLIILGREKGDYGTWVHKECDNLISDGWDIEYTKGYVEADEFSKIMNKADMLAAPLEFNFRQSTTVETYTRTKGTGSFYDALKFALPTLAPKEYNIYPDIEDFFILYNNPSHLAELITEYSQNPELVESIRIKSEKAMQKFSLEHYQEKFQEMLFEINNK